MTASFKERAMKQEEILNPEKGADMSIEAFFECQGTST
jgi:hypothetical protein